MKSYRDATRLTDGIITMRPGDFYGKGDEDTGPLTITFLPPKSLEKERDRAGTPEDFREEVQFQGNIDEADLEQGVTRQVHCVTSERGLDICDTLDELHKRWFVRHGRQLWLQIPGTEVPGETAPPSATEGKAQYVAPVFSKLTNNATYQLVISKEEYVDEQEVEEPPETSYAPYITLKMRLQTFNEWSKHRIPTFMDLNGLRNQFWTSEDGRTPQDAESWMAWWYKEVLFFQWQAEDVYFGGVGNLIGNVSMRLYQNLEFYFPWGLMAFAFWDIDSLFFLFVIVGIGFLFKIVDKNTKQNHEYSQLLKALALIALPFAYVYYSHGLLSSKQLFWSIVFYFVCINLLLRLGAGVWNVRSRRRAFGYSFNNKPGKAESKVDKKGDSVAGGDTERSGLGASASKITMLVESRQGDAEARNEDELKNANVFVNRLLMPRFFGQFRRILPVGIMVLLSIGSFFCVAVSTWLMAMMFNGRVAEAWRRAYFRSTATAAEAPAAAPPPPPSGGGDRQAGEVGFGADGLSLRMGAKKGRSSRRRPQSGGIGGIQEAS